MAFSPKAFRARQALARGVIHCLLAAGACLLALGLRDGGWILALTGFLVAGSCLGVLLVIEGESWIERFFVALTGSIGRWRYGRAETKYWRRQAAEAEAVRLSDLEERVNVLVALQLNERLAQLEQAEAWRSQQEWVELREVWRLLILDPKTPDELRDSCREWLAKYPEALEFTARRLEQAGFLKAKDLALDENWERREQHKWRVQ